MDGRFEAEIPSTSALAVAPVQQRHGDAGGDLDLVVAEPTPATAKNDMNRHHDDQEEEEEEEEEGAWGCALLAVVSPPCAGYLPPATAFVATWTVTNTGKSTVVDLAVVLIVVYS